MSISGFFQFILGFILGVILLVAGSVGAAYYFFNRMASAPAKPVFSEETLPESELETPSAEATSASETSSAQPKIVTTPEPKSEEKEEKLPAGAYRATVTWPNGLSLRAQPSLDAERLGGIDYNTEVVILGYSDDKVWQQIRLGNGDKAWIKAGNVEKIDE